MSEQQKTREVDLLQLIQSTGKGIVNLVTGVWDAIMWCLFFAFKYYIALILFVLAGLGFGLIKSINYKQVYKSDMIVRSNAVKSFEYRILMDELNLYFEDGSEIAQKKVAQLTGLPIDVVDQVVLIETFPGININDNEIVNIYDEKEAYNVSDTINVHDKHFLKLRAYVTNPNVFDQLSSGIKKFSEDHKYLTQSNEARLSHAMQLLTQHKKEVEMLEKLQNSQYSNSGETSIALQNNKFRFKSEPPLVYYAKISLVEAIREYSQEVNHYKDNITIVNDFTLVEKPHGSKMYNIIVSGILFLALGYISLLVWYFLRKVSGKYSARI